MKALPTIHMIKKGEEIPFDNVPYRAIFFDYTEPDDIESAKTELKSAVEETIKPGAVEVNPVTQARGMIELRAHATEAQRVLLDAIQELRTRMSILEASRDAAATVRTRTDGSRPSGTSY